MERKFEKEYKVWFYAAIFLIVIWVFAINMISSNYEKKKVEYMEAEIDSFQSKIEVTLDIYEFFSQYIFEETIATEEVLSLMEEVSFSEGEDLSELRQKLLMLLEEKFETMRRYRFNRLNIYLPDGESFLRLHMPHNYGENVLRNRQSMNIADSERRPVFVFEEGREYSGYRFIYPLHYNGKYVGTVEMSISPGSLLEGFSKIYPERDTFFLMKKESLEYRYSSRAYKNGELCNDLPESKKFSGVQVISEERNMAISEKNSDILIEQACKNIDEYLTKDRSFNYFETIDDKRYLINFSQVKDISNQTVAYFISVSENERVVALENGFKTHIIVLSALAVFLLSMTLLFSIYHVKLRRISQIDHLTKIYNRHKFNEIITNEFSRFERYGSSFSILMIDIDCFKQVNDTYGHNMGDRVLKKLAKTIYANIRKSDAFARWGGEEFICLLPNTNIDGAMVAGEKIRSLVETTQIDKVGKITVSVGVACISEANDTVEKLIERADKALYNAKNTGRNRVSK